MSVFGSLFTSVSALSAQSQSLGMISNNIANVNTIGFKRTEAGFSSLVTASSRNSLYSPGSVRSVQKARIDEQGILQQSSSTTDVAISGNGFFVVRSGTGADAEISYSRAGSFSENQNGILTNLGGFSLMGWPLDQDGNLPSAQADISSLVPVDVAFLGGLTQPTTSAALSLNLDANEGEDTYPVTTGYSADFTRGFRVFDSLGEAQDMELNFVKIQSPTATVTGSQDISDIEGLMSDDVDFDATDQFDITIGANGPFTITLNGTRGDLLNDLNSITDGLGQPLVFAEFNDVGQLVMKARNVSEAITLADGVGTPLADGLGLASGATAAPAAPSMLAATEGTPNSEGWWYVEMVSPLGNTLIDGYMNFNGDGSLNAAEDANGETNITLSNVNWGNGSENQDIDIDISSFSQFSGEYNVVFTEQNGAELGLRTGVTIDNEGFVIAQFSNGQSSKIYKLPLATFANTNGLNEQTGNTFTESDISGEFNLREANTGGAGTIEGSAVEGSNVDLANEFSKMIVTQRAYSAGTKVITTADEMTAELLRLR